MENKIFFDIKRPNIEVREDNSLMTIQGIIPYESRSLDMGFFEEIKPSAFNKTIADKADVKLLQNHDSLKPLARTKNDTLILRNESDGLHFEATLNPNITYHRDVFETIKNNIADGVSFGFQVIKDSFRKENKKIIRDLIEVKLKEISVGVVFPAYEASSAYVREVRELYENQNHPQENQPEETTGEEIRDEDKEAEAKRLEQEEQDRIKSTLTKLQELERKLDILKIS